MIRRLLCLLGLLSACLTTAGAQRPASGPQIGYVYPAGGQQGTTLRVSVGGQLLRSVDDARVSGPGVRATVVEYVRALGVNELSDLNRFLRDMVRMRWSARTMAAAAKAPDEQPVLPDHPWLRDLDQKSLTELTRLRARLFDPRQQLNAQIADQVVLEIAIVADAPVGDRELRLASPGGLTNPVRFQVGGLPEVREEDVVAPADPAGAAVALPAMLNGRIDPGQVDRFYLQARQGQQLVLRLQARRLIPYLADAVPGWFQATMALYGAEGQEVAYADDHGFDPDPVLVCKIPSTGVYRLEVRDAIYRGRDDFVYRITAGELPYITRLFPLGARSGAPASASLAGWNLPMTTLSLDTAPGGAALRQARLPQSRSAGNDLPYAVSDLPEWLELEPNDTVDAPQQVTLPLVVNGRLNRVGDLDMFRLQGRAGEELVAEVQARRLGSPLDATLRLLDAGGNVVAFNDDHPDPESGLLTHHADPYLRVRLPQDGAYWVCLSDAQQQGDEACAYRLRLSAPQPDFSVRLTPSALNLPAGRTATLTAHAIRKDGFAGDVDLVLKDAPAGMTLTNARLPAGEATATMTVTVPRGLPRQTLSLQIEAQAEIGGNKVTRPAVPAEDMMQAFAYRHLVPQQEMLLTVTGSKRVPAVWRPLVPGLQLSGAGPLQLPLGQLVQVQLRAAQPLPAEARTLRFRLGSPPRGVTLRGATATATGVTLTVKADAYLARAGTEANLLIELDTLPAGAGLGPVTLGVLPPIPIRIVHP